MTELITFSLNSVVCMVDSILMYHTGDWSKHLPGQRVSGLESTVIVGILGIGTFIYKYIHCRLLLGNHMIEVQD